MLYSYIFFVYVYFANFILNYFQMWESNSEVKDHNVSLIPLMPSSAFCGKLKYSYMIYLDRQCRPGSGLNDSYLPVF